ncbi:tripartite tricarboxylate transporter substrate binding protein [Xenophilus azovorans]|uniref:tripartite tricarboxylate transporter substrate binding protein n=1 Tax=Xenophilus azovorans TaxID=151755 RepID=UPI0006920B77|nr:tripartite tricarboxylate transporter substrate binding protein [Xenophilus azovorans]
MPHSVLACTARLLWAFAAWLLAATAHAAWPDRQITIIVPFPAGGLTDVAARHLAQGLQEELKQPVVVENRVGAGGMIGTELASKARPDGYTLLVNSPSHVINQAFRSRMPYDALRDFTPVAMLLSSPMVLVVHPSVPANTLGEYLAYAKTQNGGASFGSTGAGGTSHLAGEMLRLMTKAPMTHVPYKGANPAVNDLLGGQLPSIFLDVATVAQHVGSGRLKAIAMSSAARSETLPSVPTVAEQGFARYDVSTWIALYGPARLPEPITTALNAIAVRTMGSARERDWLRQNGAVAGTMSAPQFRRFVQDELEKWTQFNKEAKVQVD